MRAVYCWLQFFGDSPGDSVVCYFISFLLVLEVCQCAELGMMGSFLALLCLFLSWNLFCFLLWLNTIFLHPCVGVLITLCSSGLMIVNYLILCLSWNVFDISVDFFLKDNFVRYSNLGWQLLTFTKLNSLDNTSRYISLLFFFLLMNITFTCLKVQESSLIFALLGRYTRKYRFGSYFTIFPF